jgi:hypothetical protein
MKKCFVPEICHANKLDSDEEMFWTELISNYLEPLHHNEETKRLVAESLKELRNKVAFAFFFINGLWLAIMTAMHEIKGHQIALYYHFDSYLFFVV